MRLRCVVAAAVAAALLLPGAAYASTIGIVDDVMTIEGTEGVQGLQLFEGCISRSAPCMTIISTPFGPADPLSFSTPRCSAFGSSVECDLPVRVVAMLGGGDDYFTTGLIPVAAELHGGSGADSLSGGPGHDKVYGEAGNDFIGGYAGDDLIDGGEGDDALDGDLTQVSKTAGSDVFVGGPGSKDYVDYGPRLDALTVSLDGLANDGGVGEQDDVRSDVEGIVGGRGDDTLTGNDGANQLDGGGDGNDTLIGAGGDDELFGFEGNDRLSGDGGVDRLQGGNGDDNLDGGGGVDRFEGDDIGDPDCLSNPSVGCPSGMDTIQARDGLSEYVGCGPGVDTAVVDIVDQVDDNARTLNVCEHVDRAESGAVAPPATSPPGTVQTIAPPLPGTSPPGTAQTIAPTSPVSSAGTSTPRLSRLSVTPLRGGRRALVRYTLSAPATVTFTLKRRVRRSGQTRFVTIRGSVRHAGRAGPNTARFPLRLAGHRVTPGVYRLVAVARDAAGATSRPAQATLRVLR